MTGEELRRRREKLGLNQRELAERLGVRGNTVYRWEASQRAIPSIAALALDALEGPGAPVRLDKVRRHLQEALRELETPL